MEFSPNIFYFSLLIFATVGKMHSVQKFLFFPLLLSAEE